LRGNSAYPDQQLIVGEQALFSLNSNANANTLFWTIYILLKNSAKIHKHEKDYTKIHVYKYAIQRGPFFDAIEFHTFGISNILADRNTVILPKPNGGGPYGVNRL
jgi:hypothetical protein